MESETGVAFMIGRRKTTDRINIVIPVTAAIVTVMFLGGSRHHPSACSVVGELAMVISDEQLKQALEVSIVTAAISLRAGLDDNRHKPVRSRFHLDPDEGLSFGGSIHPMELYGVALSCEAFVDEIDRDEEPSVYNSLMTWSRAAARFVEDREMLAVYQEEGLA